MNPRYLLALLPLAAAAALAVLLMQADEAPQEPAPPAPRTDGPPRASRTRRSGDARPADAAEAPEPPPPPDAASLLVRVTSAGTPRSGATVTLTDADCGTWTATTGDAGTPLVASLPPGATEVRVEAPGSLAATRAIVLRAREDATAEFALGAAAVLDGVLVDAGGGAPLAGAELEVVVVDGATGEERAVGETVTDEQGRYRVEQVPAEGRVVVRVVGPGRKRREVVVPMGKDAGARIELPRDAGGRLSGFVRTPDGGGLQGATVALRRADAAPHDPPERVADSGPGGAYAFEDVPLGAELVAFASAKAWAESARTEPWKLDASSQPASLDFALRRPASLSVVVQDEAEREVRFTVRLDEEAAATVLSLSSSTVERGGLAPGLHRVRVSADGFLPVDRRVELADGEAKTIEVTLVRGLEITGRVVGADGRGVDGAVVVASDPDLPKGAKSMRSDLAQAAVASGGVFRVSGLVAGRVRLRAYVPAGPESARQEVGVPATGVTLVIAKGTRIALHAVLPPHTERPDTVTVAASADVLSPNIPSEDEIELRPEPRKDPTFVECEVAPGHAWLRVVVPGCAPAVLKIAPSPGKLVDLGDVRFERALSVAGIVRDEQGQPLHGVSVWSSLDDAAKRSTSAADGSFAVAGLASGAVVLRAEAGDRFGAVVVNAGETAAELVLRPKGWVRGTVTDADGVPVRDAIVAILHDFAASSADAGRSESARADAQGRFRVAVAAGRVRVHAGVRWIEADVAPGGETSVAVPGR